MKNFDSLINSYKNRQRVIVMNPSYVGLVSLLDDYASENNFEHLSWSKISSLLKRSDHMLSKVMRDCDRDDSKYPVDAIVDFIVSQHIVPTEQKGKSWILSGYPKNKDEYDALIKRLEYSSISPTSLVVLSLDGEGHDSIKESKICPKCGKDNFQQNAMYCDQDGSLLVISEDKEVKGEWYKSDLIPLCEKLSQEVDGHFNLEVIKGNDKLAQLKDYLEKMVDLDHLLHSDSVWRGAWYNCMIETKLPIFRGHFKIAAFQSKIDNDVHLALIYGDVSQKENVPVRIHSSCMTGDIFSSLKCDCGSQLDGALQQIKEHSFGVLIYLMQEGRGIGIVNKLKAYKLQDMGVDTVDANRILNLPDDCRDYRAAVDMINYCGIESVALISNNPLKSNHLTSAGVLVSQIIPSKGDVNCENLKYLEVKNARMNHTIDASVFKPHKE